MSAVWKAEEIYKRKGNMNCYLCRNTVLSE